MAEQIYKIDYAGHTVYYSFVYPNTRWQFRNYIKKADTDHYDIRAAQDRIETTRKHLPDDSTDSYVEYRSLIGLTAKELLKYRRCIFHSVSFLYRGYIWLLTAPSGTGKTTQYRNWQDLFPGEITMISGDMPVLSLAEDTISVHPTCWNGKENLGNKISGPLGGIFLLEQGKYNTMMDVDPQKDILTILYQFIVRPDTEQDIQNLMDLMEAMFVRYPMYKMINLGDAASTQLLRDTINGILEKLPEVSE